MNLWHAIGVGIAGALFFCCASTEPLIAPLGFGPLAKAEIAERERNAAQTQKEKPKRPRTTRSITGSRTLEKSASQAAAWDKSTSDKSTVNDAGTTTASLLATPDASVAARPGDWLGLWHGRDTTQFQIPSFPPDPMVDENARIRVETSGSQDIKFILIDSSTEHDLCTLLAKLEGNQAKIETGQPCFGNEDESANLTIKVKSGSATLVDSRLTLDLALDAEVQSDEFQTNGSVEYHFEGKR